VGEIEALASDSERADAALRLAAGAEFAAFHLRFPECCSTARTLLVDRGINLSVSQVHRLATGTPERLSLPVLAALCDIFDCTPAELIATKAENAVIRKTATDDGVVNLNARRPKRARLRPEE
jgi:DNA-binding Xre family transcriptional regulator